MGIFDMKSKKSKTSAAELKENNGSDKSIAKRFDNLKSTPTIISKDLVIEGEVSSAGVLEVEGSIKGNIKGNIVVLRESGSIYGEVIAESISIRGNFSGKVRSNSINISGKAKVSGEIEYNTLSVEDGACIDGQFKRMNSDNQAKSENDDSKEK